MRDTTADGRVAIVETAIGEVAIGEVAGIAPITSRWGSSRRGVQERRAVVRVGMAIVHGRSMLPTLRHGDRLLVCHGGRVRAGRLVVCRLPGRTRLMVKRATSRDGDGWWVERDNPDEGVDSWQVGAIPDGDMVATVVGRLWPRPRRWRDREPPGPADRRISPS